MKKKQSYLWMVFFCFIGIWCVFGSMTSDASTDKKLKINLSGKKVYANEKTLRIRMKDTDPDAKIYYTLDKKVPTEKSFCYRSPVKLKRTTVVKACIYKNGKRISKVFRWKIRIRSPWTITQYSDRTGLQAMFYTLKSQKGTLIVIDGGTAGNASYVREIIEKNGGVVDAWFLTHPHPDHIGAFNTIFKNRNGIKIKKIYDCPLDYSYYDRLDQPWDEINVYAEYLRITKKSKKVHHMKRGDSVTIGGMTVKALNSYDRKVKKRSRDICNDSSLVLKFTNNKESMIFCGDAHSPSIASYLKKKWKKELKADYVQTGHHGNNSFPVSFYRYVGAKKAFFDAPSWLLYGEQYSTKELMSWFHKNGVKTIDYTTAPNKLILN